MQTPLTHTQTDMHCRGVDLGFRSGGWGGASQEPYHCHDRSVQVQKLVVVFGRFASTCEATSVVYIPKP